MGVTGEDLLREQAPELAGRIHLIKPLGFGFANVVVAVPQYWIDVSTMADLDDVCAAFAAKHRRRLRIATKYLQLTRSFFAHMGISDYRIVESAGATEGAPAAGTAEAIVDITTTGATLAANGLKILEDGTILESQAQLAASLTADWTGKPAPPPKLCWRGSARASAARTSQILRVRLDKNADKILAALAKDAGASVLSRPTDPTGEFSILCPRAKLMDAIASLRKQGCDAPATTQDADYVFDTANPLYACWQRRLAKSTSLRRDRPCLDVGIVQVLRLPPHHLPDPRASRRMIVEDSFLPRSGIELAVVAELQDRRSRMHPACALH